MAHSPPPHPYTLQGTPLPNNMREAAAKIGGACAACKKRFTGPEQQSAQPAPSGHASVHAPAPAVAREGPDCSCLGGGSGCPARDAAAVQHQQQQKQHGTGAAGGSKPAGGCKRKQPPSASQPATGDPSSSQAGGKRTHKGQRPPDDLPPPPGQPNDSNEPSGHEGEDKVKDKVEDKGPVMRKWGSCRCGLKLGAGGAQRLLEACSRTLVSRTHSGCVQAL